MISKKHVFYFLAITLFMGSIQGNAQKKYTIASLSYMGSRNANYNNIPAISSDLGYLALNISLPIPIELNEKTAIITGVRANNWSVSYTPEQLWPTNYYSVGLNLGVNYKLNKNKSLLFVLLPKLNSSHIELNSENIQLGFLSTYSVRKNENFLWKLGMYYNNEFFGPFVVPIYGFDWDINTKVNISGDLPIYGKLNYKVKETISTGLGYVALVSSYRLTDEFNNAYTSRFAIEPYVFGEAKLLKNTYFNTKVGYAISRKYPIYEKDDKLDWQLSFMKFGDDRIQHNPIIENGFFFEFGIAYKIDLPK